MGWGLCYDDFAGIFLPCVGVCYVEIGVLVRAGMIEGVGRCSVVSVSTVVCTVLLACCADQIILKCTVVEDGTKLRYGAAGLIKRKFSIALVLMSKWVKSPLNNSAQS